MEKASGVNLEAKSGAGVPEAVCIILSTPAMSLKPVILALAFPLDYFSDVERGGCWLGNSLSSILFYPGFVPWRGHSSFTYSVKTLDAVPSPPYRTCYHSLSRLKDAYDAEQLGASKSREITQTATDDTTV